MKFLGNTDNAAGGKVITAILPVLLENNPSDKHPIYIL